MKHLYFYLTILLLVSLTETVFIRAQQAAQPAANNQTPPNAQEGQSAEGITQGVSHRAVKVSNNSTTSLNVTIYMTSTGKAKNGMTTTKLRQETHTFGPKTSQTFPLTSEQFIQAVEIESLIK